MVPNVSKGKLETLKVSLVLKAVAISKQISIVYFVGHLAAHKKYQQN